MAEAPGASAAPDFWPTGWPVGGHLRRMRVARRTATALAVRHCGCVRGAWRARGFGQALGALESALCLAVTGTASTEASTGRPPQWPGAQDLPAFQRLMCGVVQPRHRTGYRRVCGEAHLTQGTLCCGRPSSSTRRFSGGPQSAMCGDGG